MEVQASTANAVVPSPEKFLASIANTKFFCPDGKPNPEWKVFYGDTWESARKTTEEAVLGIGERGFLYPLVTNSAWDAASNALQDEAEPPLRRTYDNAGPEVWDAVFDTAVKQGALFGNSPGFPYMASAASEDATLYLRYLSEKGDFEGKDKYLAHAKARWEVWQKGYALLCDVNGVLYVYASTPITSTESKLRR